MNYLWYTWNCLVKIRISRAPTCIPMQAWQNGLWEFHLALFLLVTFVAFLDSWHISERHDRARYAPLEKNSAMHACVARAKSTRSQREHHSIINKSARIPLRRALGEYDARRCQAGECPTIKTPAGAQHSLWRRRRAISLYVETFATYGP
jgi:hypothetical protein